VEIEKETEILVRALEDNMRYIGAVKEALQRRKDKFVQYQTSVALSGGAGAGAGGEGGEEEDSADLLKNRKEVASRLKKECFSMTQMLVSEFDWFKAEKQQQLRDMFLQYIKLKVR
jgi:hypothetical protein